MAHRPGLDDDAALAELLRLWRSGQILLESRQADIVARLRELDRDGVDNRLVERRLRLQLTRLRGLENAAVVEMANIRAKTSRWVASGGVAGIYEAGAIAAVGATGFSWVQPHLAAVALLSQDLFDDVLALTFHVEDSTKLWVRRLSRELTVAKLTGGRTAREVAREFADQVRDDVTLRRVGGVTYRNGAVHGFGEYADMLVRTKTGTVYNLGGLNNGKLAGIEYYEVFDGFSCQWYSHNEGPMANGMIVDYATAFDNPLSHPGCVRSFGARPDVKVGDDLDSVESLVSEDSRADQRAFEASLGRR